MKTRAEKIAELKAKRRPPIVYATVPKLWPGSTIVCLASGPSLTADDVDACRGRARLLAVKDAIRLAPDADALYACDAKWWRAHPSTRDYTGPKYGMEPVREREDVQLLMNTGQIGLELQPNGLRTYQNSGGQAINLAMHLGATTILLLGYDMQPQGKRHHWFGMHAYNKNPPPYGLFLALMPTMCEPLKQLGVRVINCTPGSALTCFESMPLRQALASVAEGVAA